MRVGSLNVHVASLAAPIGAIGLLALVVVFVGIVGLMLAVLVGRPWDNTGRWSRPRHDHNQTPESQYS